MEKKVKETPRICKSEEKMIAEGWTSKSRKALMVKAAKIEAIPHIKQTKPYQNSLLCPGEKKEDNIAIEIPHIDWITMGIPKEALAELFKEDETSMTETLM